MATQWIRVTQVRSVIGRPRNQRVTLRSLGIRRMNHQVDLQDNEAIRGMIRKVSHLVRVENIEEKGQRE